MIGSAGAVKASAGFAEGPAGFRGHKDQPRLAEPTT
jgi:hypothetical protein